MVPLQRWTEDALPAPDSEDQSLRPELRNGPVTGPSDRLYGNVIRPTIERGSVLGLLFTIGLLLHDGERSAPAIVASLEAGWGESARHLSYHQYRPSSVRSKDG